MVAWQSPGSWPGATADGDRDSGDRDRKGALHRQVLHGIARSTASTEGCIRNLLRSGISHFVRDVSARLITGRKPLMSTTVPPESELLTPTETFRRRIWMACIWSWPVCAVLF